MDSRLLDICDFTLFTILSQTDGLYENPFLLLQASSGNGEISKNSYFCILNKEVDSNDLATVVKKFKDGNISEEKKTIIF